MAYICIILLLMGSAFFSGTEIAYTSLSKLKMKKEDENLTKAEKLMNFIYNHYEYSLSTVLVGNNLVNIGATSVATVLAVNLAGKMGDKMTDDLASTIVTVVMTILILIIGEITPKMIARRCSNSIAKAVAYPLMIMMVLFFPVVWITTIIANLFGKIWKKIHNTTKHMRQTSSRRCSECAPASECSTANC